MRSAGIVYLVGAGPGDPDLITVRGLRCLQRADVLVYDRLVAPELLDEAPTRALRIDVGKEAGNHRCAQEEINALLVRHAQAGRVVVRLKGGDPFVFGRGGEEALACAAAGVDWEVVPGVTSAISVPARAGIPVTHRGVATSFAVVTGHCLGDDRVDWEALARIDTLLILMGLSRLGAVADLLQAHGRAADTPAAVISRGTLPDERVVVTTLGGLAAAVAREELPTPALVVVGEVVRVREELLRVARQRSAERAAFSSPRIGFSGKIDLLHETFGNRSHVPVAVDQAGAALASRRCDESIGER